MACHVKPSSQLTVHAARRLQHGRIYSLHLSSWKAISCGTPSKHPPGRPTYPSNQSHQTSAESTDCERSPRLQHAFRTCNHAARCQPMFVQVHCVTNSQRSPQPVHRRHEANRPKFMRSDRCSAQILSRDFPQRKVFDVNRGR